MGLLAALATLLEIVGDIAFFGAPFSRRTTRVLGAVLILLLAMLGWAQWQLSAS